MIKACAICGKEFDGHGNAKHCPDCRHEAQLESQRRHYANNHVSPVKICPRCQKEFSGRGKYCDMCQVEARRELQQQAKRRYRESHREQRTKTVKPIEKFRTLTKGDVSQLMNLIREVYSAGKLILNFGGQSALTDEQLAIVEQKYPDHSKNLGDLRKQKFCDAIDNFIEVYQTLK